MAKRKIWILGTLAVVVAVGAFLYGRYDRGGTFPTLGAGVNGVSPEATKQCQDVTIGYIPDKGVIIPDESLCQISAFSQFGTFSTMDAAQQDLEEIQTEHSQLFLGHDLVVWSDQTPDLDTVYSVRTGFADEMDANQFCALANKQGLDCTVVPVIVNNQPTLGAGTPSPDDPEPVDPEIDKICQDEEVEFDDMRGVIVPLFSSCLVDAFSQFGVYTSLFDAESAMTRLLSKHGDFFRPQRMVLWTETTRTGDVQYSLRVGFRKVEFAQQYCNRALAMGLSCIVVPVVISGAPTLGATGDDQALPNPITPEMTQMCQDGELQYDPARGVIVSARAQCMIDAFSQFGVFNTRIDAENMRENLIRQHPLLFIGSEPIVWTDTTPRGDIAYSLRIGFIKESVAEQFCELARENQVSCTVVPVIINGGI